MMAFLGMCARIVVGMVVMPLLVDLLTRADKLDDLDVN
jgi:hypothetical protein